MSVCERFFRLPPMSWAGGGTKKSVGQGFGMGGGFE